MMRILALETSCDETAAAVVQRIGPFEGRILSNIVHSQFEDHAAFGGVVPEIAARAHAELIETVIRAALQVSDCTLDQIDAIAATSGPGLVGGLIVGVMSAKAMAAATGKPFLGINHLEGHALTAGLTDGIRFPYLLLLVSGGHTQVLLVNGVGDYERWATTIDDALGEAFDKTAKLLGLSWPGGPEVERRAKFGNAARFTFPHPLRGEKRLDFSFSGLKTAVRQAIEHIDLSSEQDVADICASFQKAVCDTLEERLAKSLQAFQSRFPQAVEPVFVVAGGVAANQNIRTMITRLTASYKMRFLAPPMNLCTDNAAMIAWAAAERLALGQSDTMDLAPRPRWPLDEKSASNFGSGRKGPKA
jgi:N6-L-threonylcarbamoyladenine synthase